MEAAGGWNVEASKGLPPLEKSTVSASRSVPGDPLFVLQTSFC